jgi:hypothetical protein
MSRERFEQTLVGGLEQELQAALRLEPSADFADRVRARIARNPPVAGGRWRVLLAAAAVCILTIGLTWQTARRPSRDARPTVARVGMDVPLEPTAPAVRSKTSDAAVVRRPAIVRPNRRVLERPEPEVIVAPDGARALARLLELVRTGAVDEESLTPVAPTPAPAALDVAPIVVPLISIPNVEIGGAAPGERATRE